MSTSNNRLQKVTAPWVSSPLHNAAVRRQKRRAIARRRQQQHEATERAPLCAICATPLTQQTESVADRDAGIRRLRCRKCHIDSTGTSPRDTGDNGPPQTPTLELPGSEGKQEILIERQRRGEQLNCAGDAEGVLARVSAAFLGLALAIAGVSYCGQDTAHPGQWRARATTGKRPNLGWFGTSAEAAAAVGAWRASH